VKCGVPGAVEKTKKIRSLCLESARFPTLKVALQ
jgi:hypothetical protein